LRRYDRLVARTRLSADQPAQLHDRAPDLRAGLKPVEPAVRLAGDEPAHSIESRAAAGIDEQPRASQPCLRLDRILSHPDDAAAPDVTVVARRIDVERLGDTALVAAEI
jgi:hypothetical protein